MAGNVIKIRREEVERELSLLRERVDALSAELNELDIAERVFDRLAGAKRNASGAGDKPKPTTVAKAKAGTRPTLREMVKASLMDARQRGMPGLTPKGMREYIKSTYGRDIGQQANTTASRMWRELKEIDKDTESGLFSLPSKEKSSEGPSDTTEDFFRNIPGAKVVKAT